jgi:phosphatidylserine decarboxylase
MFLRLRGENRENRGPLSQLSLFFLLFRFVHGAFTLPRALNTIPLSGMKHSGKARKAAFKIMVVSAIAVAAIWALGAFATVIIAVLGAIAVAITPFAIFTFYFFRDPNAKVPPGANLILCPAHGKVDVIDRTTEPEFMGGECQRVSIFLSVLDVHVQNAPITGKVAFFKYTEGEFMNAIRTECAQCNENALLGFDATEPRMKLGLRLIAGVIARRIVPYIKPGDEVVKGERISLVQFGSRADIYLPLDVKIKVKLGDHVTGGETILAAFE